MAIWSGDVEQLRAILAADPELANARLVKRVTVETEVRLDPGFVEFIVPVRPGRAAASPSEKLRLDVGLGCRAVRHRFRRA